MVEQQNQQKIRVFSDFDGTISFHDVGATLFNHFGNGRNLGSVRLWMEKKIDSRECLLRECAYLSATEAEMIDKLQEIEIRKGFTEFLALLDSRGIPLHLLSDGFAFYIQAFLAKAGINHLDIHANQAQFFHRRIYPSFPHYERGCGFCGTCKGERIESLANEDELRVYIGDGLSDRCALGVADLLFARGDLARLCREKEVDYQPFDDFFDVIEYFRRNLL